MGSFLSERACLEYGARHEKGERVGGTVCKWLTSLIHMIFLFVFVFVFVFLQKRALHSLCIHQDTLIGIISTYILHQHKSTANIYQRKQTTGIRQKEQNNVCRNTGKLIKCYVNPLPHIFEM